MNVLRAQGRAGLGFSTGLFGNGFALTASTLERVPFSANSIAEDVEYRTKLAAEGIRVRWVADAFVHAHMAAPGAAQAAQEGRWEGGRSRWAGRATGHLMVAVLRGRWRALETLADVWSLCLSRAAFLALLLTMALPVALAARLCLGLRGGLLCSYVLEAALLGAEAAAGPCGPGRRSALPGLEGRYYSIVLRQSRSRAEGGHGPSAKAPLP